MNRNLSGIIDFLDSKIISLFHSKIYAQNFFLKKKLSDFYFSRLIPDFFYVIPFSNNYLPTMMAAKTTISTICFLAFAFFSYQRNFKHLRDKTYKYQFNLYTSRFCTNVEKELLKADKLAKRKIILN